MSDILSVDTVESTLTCIFLEEINLISKFLEDDEFV